ncbi:MAG: UDP-N-acetylmuramate--L-alanine ligase [Crocinitomicaceae bacterium]|nr:UDP-N-acetylmuramate--L-alanine ligase [Crocinitomicaceae bacterium]
MTFNQQKNTQTNEIVDIRIVNISLDNFENAYFLGIGGIGMSALARYFKSLGWNVAGYDKTPSPLTESLQQEGIDVHYEDRNSSISSPYGDKTKTLVIVTPAVPKNLGELLHFQFNEFEIVKRSEVLGLITKTSKGLGVAGTHGKTTTSTMLAHLLDQSEVKCTAFLGGISSNFNSNLVLNPSAAYTVIEADEFDRSFLRLSPFASIITSADPDHLDIYGDAAHFREGFELYAGLHPENGVVVQKYGLNLPTEAKTITYGINEPDSEYCGLNVRVENEKYLFDVQTPSGKWEAVELGIPGIHNAENAIACIALCQFLGVDEATIRSGLKTFLGVKRRFESIVKSQNLIYIDDYAHHPTELKALIDSIRLIYPDRKITGVFQPHLFTRTRDFFEGFVAQLSRLDEVILLPIYPAREEPIPGVTSDALLEKITAPDKKLMLPGEVVNYLSAHTEGVFLTIGAGDIDRIVNPLKKEWSE